MSPKSFLNALIIVKVFAIGCILAQGCIEHERRNRNRMSDLRPAIETSEHPAIPGSPVRLFVAESAADDTVTGSPAIHDTAETTAAQAGGPVPVRAPVLPPIDSSPARGAPGNAGAGAVMREAESVLSAPVVRVPEQKEPAANGPSASPNITSPTAPRAASPTAPADGTSGRHATDEIFRAAAESGMDDGSLHYRTSANESRTSSPSNSGLHITISGDADLYLAEIGEWRYRGQQIQPAGRFLGIGNRAEDAVRDARKHRDDGAARFDQVISGNAFRLSPER